MSDVRTYLVPGGELADERTYPPGGTTDKWRVVLYADHLAALERARVDVLREVRVAIQVTRDYWRGRYESSDGDDSMYGRRCRDYYETHDADLAVIARLINAATTGDTDG